ncbi:hypothetical protein [Candidatus Thioglobus sp.]|uniref:hypothetical protein n=1 Tax=Candidatus Thioglobus sp. TaxID=2026721 RepID=UPI003D0C431C
MINQARFELKASKIYFGISVFTHGCTFVSVWFFSFNLYLSLALSLILIAHFHYLNSHIFLKKSDAIQDFLLAGSTLTTTDKSNTQKQYPYVYCSYQSRFLVIINLGKRSVVVFKDSLADHSLSTLNRLFNA